MRVFATSAVGGPDLDVDIDGIVFDKDGTLIDLNATWAPVTRRAIDAMVDEAVGAAAGVDEASGVEAGALRAHLWTALGVDDEGLLVPNGVAAVEPVSVMADVAVAVLDQFGSSAPIAVERLRHGQVDVGALEIVPLGPVRSTLERLAAAGLSLAVATSDQRDITVATLDRLGWSDLLPHLACGDDAIGAKPDPVVVTSLAEAMGTTADRLMMVGDSVGDIRTGSAAGCAATVGIIAGGARPDGADVFIADIDALQLVGSDSMFVEGERS